MSQPTEKSDENKNSKYTPFITLLIIAIAVVFVGGKVVQDPLAVWSAFCNIAIVVLGFGAVIFVHEFGHFAAAKAVGIMVEGFSLGFGPIVISFKRVRQGLQIRVLPSLIPGKDGLGALRVIIPLSGKKDGETEYRINLIPLGGFVKMLGQEDVAADKSTEDPRAFPNKAVWKRSIVISAGVIMNVICGVIVFMIVFGRGYAMPPAIVGDVLAHSPAAQAGIRSGDVITAINGKEPFGFMDVFIAAAFADENEKINLTVKHSDESVETLAVRAKLNEALDIKAFGFSKPSTLTIAKVEPGDFLEEMKRRGIMPGDKIVAVNGETISQYGQLSEVLYSLPGRSLGDPVNLSLERTDPDGRLTSAYTLEIPMVLSPVGPIETWGQALGMAPRLKVASVDPNFPSAYANLEKGDIILKVGAQPYPTLEELSKHCIENKNQPVELLVQRIVGDEIVEKNLTIIPQIDPRLSFWAKLFSRPKPRFGFLSASDFEVPVIAVVREKAVENFPELAQLPRGARITAIAGQNVSNWQDIILLLIPNIGKTIDITFQSAPDQTAQTIDLALPNDFNWLGFAFRPNFGPLINLPLEIHNEVFKGENWRENFQLGLNQSYSFLAQTYLFIRGMIMGSVSPSAASGPVGILKMSYTIAETRDSGTFLYFMAIISVCVAAFNFLPIPILDGGHFLMLIIESIKGSPVSLRVQEIASYAGLILILGFFLFVTFNDIIKVVTGQI